VRQRRISFAQDDDLLIGTRDMSPWKHEGALIKHYILKHPVMSNNLPFKSNC